MANLKQVQGGVHINNNLTYTPGSSYIFSIDCDSSSSYAMLVDENKNVWIPKLKNYATQDQVNILANDLNDLENHFEETYTNISTSYNNLKKYVTTTYTNINTSYTNLYGYVISSYNFLRDTDTHLQSQLTGLLEAKDVLNWQGSLTPSITSSNSISGTWTPSNSITTAGATFKITSNGYFGTEYVYAGDMIISYSDSASKTSPAGWLIVKSHISVLSNNGTKETVHPTKILTNVHLGQDGTLTYTYFDGNLNFAENSEYSKFGEAGRVIATNEDKPYYLSFANKTSDYSYTYVDTDIQVNPSTNVITANISGNANSSEYLNILDIRNRVHAPSFFDNCKITGWFNDKDGPMKSSWNSGITVKGQYTDYDSWQIASTSDVHNGKRNNSLYYRKSLSNNEWEPWRKILDSYNLTWESIPKPGTSDKTYITGTGKVFPIDEFSSAYIKVDLKSSGTNVNTAYYLTFVNNYGDKKRSYIDTNLNYNPYNDTLSTTNFKGALLGNANTATALKNSVSFNIYGGAVGIEQTFNGTQNVSIPITSLKESYLVWNDGKAIAGSVSPIDMAMSSVHNPNRLAFANPDGIKIEYSRDGGNNWTNYGASNEAKIKLVSNIWSPFYLGGRSTGSTANDRLRITLAANDMKIYTAVKKLLIEVSTDGASGTSVTVEYCTNAEKTKWITLGTYPVSGWSGWNSIPVSSLYGFGSTSGQHKHSIRLTFSQTAPSSDTNAKPMQILSLCLFGDEGWVTPSNMARHNHIYNFDYLQNVTFPANLTASNIYATNFEGTASKVNIKQNTSANSTYYLMLTNKSAGSTYTYTTTNIKVNPSSNTITASVFDGKATYIQTSVASASASYYLTFVNNTSGGRAYVMTDLSFNPSTEELKTSHLRLRNGNENSGSYLRFGDDNYACIYEDPDDSLNIYSGGITMKFDHRNEEVLFVNSNEDTSIKLCLTDGFIEVLGGISIINGNSAQYLDGTGNPESLWIHL